MKLLKLTSRNFYDHRRERNDGSCPVELHSTIPQGKECWNNVYAINPSSNNTKPPVRSLRYAPRYNCASLWGKHASLWDRQAPYGTGIIPVFHYSTIPIAKRSVAKFFLGVSIILSVVLAQTPYNAIAHGLFIDNTDAGSFAQGTSGFTPSFNSEFSFGNPSTWPNLKFTFLTSHYNTGEIRYENQNFVSDYGRLINTALIIPIKGKYAWGLGVRPISRKQFIMSDDSISSIIFSEDTLIFSKQISGNGGISSLYSGVAWKINEKLSIATQWDFIFGIYKEKTSTKLYSTDSPTLYIRDFQYKGTLLSAFLKSNHMTDKLKSSFYFGYQFPIGKGKIKERNDHPFRDLDEDEEHSRSDDPPFEESLVVTRSHSSFNLPSTFSFGWLYDATEKSFVSFEFILRSIKRKDNISFLNVLPSDLGNGYRVSLGILREGKIGSGQMLDKFHYRIGIFQQRHYISSPEKALSEKGFAFGIGIPFGFTQNQIDLGFRFSHRKGFLSNENEFVKQMTIGLTIGDIWLVKRRRR